MKPLEGAGSKQGLTELEARDKAQQGKERHRERLGLCEAWLKLSQGHLRETKQPKETLLTVPNSW